MISLKEYAKNKGVSYEAIRKQVKRYAEELEGHVTKQNRTQYLDDDAVRFLDSKRTENPIIIMETDKNEELERLQNENKALLVKIAELQEQLIAKGNKVEELQQQNIALLEAKTEKKSFWQRLKGD